MSPPYEQQAVALFLENFVLDKPDARYSEGYLASLLPLLRTTKPNSLLSNTVDAVGLCFFAKNIGSDSIASRAARSYLHSLNRLQAVLDQDVDCISTETMMSVYLMGLYEMMNPPGRTVHPWLAHLQGLTAITKARKKVNGYRVPDIDFPTAQDTSLGRSSSAIDQDTPAHGWYLDHSDHNETILYSSFITQDALEPNPVANDRSMSALLDDLVLRAQPILQAAASLSKKSHPGARANAQRLLFAARSHLSSFRAWPSRTPDHWQPKTVRHQIDVSELSQLGIFPGRVDVYPDLYVAALWNTYRTTLLRLCDVIAQCGKYLEIEAVPFRETEEYRALCAEAMKTCEEVCSSVAYHINNEWLNRVTTINLHASTRALGGLFLIWPLYGGSILSIVPKVHRAWMRRKLRSIGTSMGLAQATVLADTVDLWDSTDPFKPLIISQGYVFMWSANMF